MKRKRVCATTTRLYYDDSHLVEFTTNVRRQWQDSGKHLLTLDATAFYPTSGGQPHDTGTISGIQVLDVYEEDGDILHVVGAEIEKSREVLANIHWPRRHDHMQQHTGQHILSQALVEVCDTPTVGFTIGPDWSTIVLDRKPDSGALSEALDLANSVIDENRSIDVLFPSPSEIRELPIRGALPDKEAIRIVRIDGFDWSPCGGTHCKTTSDVRFIVTLGIHKEKDTFRLEFVCGRRAEAAAVRHANAISDVATMLDVGTAEVVERTRSTLDKMRSYERTIDALREDRLASDLASLLSSVNAGDNAVICSVLYDRSVQEIRQLAQMLVDRQNTVALLIGTEQDKVGLAFARSDDRSEDMNQIMRQVCDQTGCRGGGNPAFASGGGGAEVDAERVMDVAWRAVGAG